MSRRFHEKGYEVFIAETSSHHICRHSNAVKKHFVVPSPRFQPDEFIKTLVEICKTEKIDLVLPTFEEIFCLSKGKDLFPKHTKVFFEDYDTLDHLHNKWLFNQKIKTLGFNAPKSYLISSQEDLDAAPLSSSYILKPSYSRASLKIIKADPSNPPKVKINPLNPLVVQEYITGKKYCSYSIAHEGKLSAHTTYPVGFSIDGNSCLSFKAIEHPGVEKWVKTFAEKEKFTGQLAFDFIESASGELYAIECNPRGTSGLHLFQEKDNLPQAFFSAESLIKPTCGFSKKIAWGMLLYGWKGENLLGFVKNFVKVKDVVFSKSDIKPFLFQPSLFLVYMLRSLKLRESLPAMFTFDIDWNGDDAAMQDRLTLQKLH